jgi:DNA-directed RNA polymerase subunit K/omega
MKSKFESRGPSLDMDTCVVNSGGNRFNMVLIGAMRAKEIKRQNSHSDRFDHTHPVVTALLEIQEGKIGMEQLDKIPKKK